MTKASNIAAEMEILRRSTVVIPARRTGRHSKIGSGDPLK
jgi:hypothetical protein